METNVIVKRNDELDLNEVDTFDKILLSPGPGLPSEAGLMPEIIRQFSSTKSILGICLGMQAIGEFAGAKLKNLSTVKHGLSEPIVHLENDNIFRNIPVSFNVGRYHSWVIDEIDLPKELIITARDREGNIMAIQHRRMMLRGIQFHPESILSQFGKEIIENWLAE